MNLRGRNKISPEFNMSSMTDVVFLLLIFFMIASTLAKKLNTIKVKLPEAEGKSENRNTVAVTITNSKKFYIDSNITPKSNLEDKIISSSKNILGDRRIGLVQYDAGGNGATHAIILYGKNMNDLILTERKIRAQKSFKGYLENRGKVEYIATFMINTLSRF